MNLHSLMTRLQKLRDRVFADFSALHVVDGYSSHERSALRELHAMSDRDLHDIGISRGDIGHVIRAGRA